MHTEKSAHLHYPSFTLSHLALVLHLSAERNEPQNSPVPQFQPPHTTHTCALNHRKPITFSLLDVEHPQHHLSSILLLTHCRERKSKTQPRTAALVALQICPLTTIEPSQTHHHLRAFSTAESQKPRTTTLLKHHPTQPVFLHYASKHPSLSHCCFARRKPSLHLPARRKQPPSPSPSCSSYCREKGTQHPPFVFPVVVNPATKDSNCHHRAPLHAAAIFTKKSLFIDGYCSRKITVHRLQNA